MGAYDGSGGGRFIEMAAREAIAEYYRINSRLVFVPLDGDIKNELGLPWQVIRATADKMEHFFSDQFPVTDEELRKIKTFRDLEHLCYEKDRTILLSNR